MNITTIIYLAIGCILLSLLEITATEELDDSSSALVEWLQSFDSKILHTFFGAIGEFTSTAFLVASGAIYLSIDRNKGCLCLISAYLGAGISGILKTLFTRPRPIWKSAVLLGITCPKDWGTPSGHAMAGGTPLILMILLWQQKAKSLRLTLLLSLSLIITGVDRIYLGAHFYFQVILGYAFAALIASILMYAYENKWLETDSGRFLAKAHGFFLVMTLVSWGCFFVREPIWQQFWTENFETKCKGQINSQNAMNKNMIEGFLGFTMAGILLGKYLIRKISFRENNIVVAYLVFWAVVYASLKMEKYCGGLVAVLMVQRYFLGVFMSAGLPLLFSYFQKEHLSKPSL